MRRAYRIKAILETLAARDVRKAFLQACESFALKEYPVYALSRALRKFPNVVAEEQFPAAEEWRYRGVCDCEMVANGEPAWR